MILQRILLILIIVFYFVTINRGQGFISKYTFSGYVLPKFTSGQLVGENLFTFGSMADTLDGNDYLMVSKINKNGQLLSHFEFKSDSILHWFNKGFACYNGKIYTVTNNPYVSSSLISYDLKADKLEKLNTIKGEIPETTFFVSLDMAGDLEGNIIIASALNSKSLNSRRSVTQITKISHDARLIFTTHFFVKDYSVIPQSIFCMPDNSFIVACQRIVDGALHNILKNYRPLFLHYDSNGKLLKTVYVNRIFNNINDFIIDDLGNYICATSDTVHTNQYGYFNSVPMIISISSKGFMNWKIDVSDRNDSYNSFERMTTIVFDSNSRKYYSSGMGRFINEEIGSLTERNIVSICFDNKGKIFWNRKFKLGYGDTDDYCYDILKDDKNIYLLGSSRNAIDRITNKYGDNAIIIKLDNDGCLNSDCFYYGQGDNSVKFYITPNPANNKIVLLSSSLKEINVLLFDMTGKLILNKQDKFIEGILEIPIENVLPGLYLISTNVLGTDEYFTKKIVIQ